jgi:hypothetical protein
VIIGRRLPAIHLPDRRGGTAKPLTAKALTAKPLTGSLASMAGFGASYAVASLGCTIAPFLAVVVVAFRAGSISEGMVLLAAYALGMGLVVGTAAVAVALARTGLIGRLRRTGAVLPRLGGGLLVLAGGYVAWYGAWELRVLHSNAGADRVVSEAGKLQQWLAESVQRVGAGGFLVGLAGLTAAALLLGRYRHPRPLAHKVKNRVAFWHGVQVTLTAGREPGDPMNQATTATPPTASPTGWESAAKPGHEHGATPAPE